MKTNLSGSLAKQFGCICLILCWIAACSTLHPRLDIQGLPQTNYIYQIPGETGDGWEIASLRDVGINPAKITELMQDILTRRFENIHGVLLVRNGKLVLEEYFNGYAFNFSGPKFRGQQITYGQEKLHVTASVTKSVTSALVGIAVDRGFIHDVDAPMAVFFPQYMNLIDEKKSRITLEHLLTMTSGLEWNEIELWFRDPRFDLTRLWAVPDPIEYILSKDVVHEPGTYWYYSSGDVNLLGEIILKSSGLRMDAFAARYLLTPLGITEYEWDHINPDIIHASGNLKLRPRDMAKFGQLFLNGGTWNNQRIISETWTTKSTAAIVSIPKKYMLELVAREYLFWAVNAGDRYGYFWWIKSYCTDSGCFDSYLADGWGGQRIIVFPSLDLVVVFTGGNYATHEPVHEMVCEYILPAVQ
jgi:CubicO group peptidase (beta-lactamase class C family)